MEDLLEDIPNVFVNNNHSITPWINNSFAIMHNSCTSAIEATISGKPIITYTPFDQKYFREILMSLGIKLKPSKNSQKQSRLYLMKEN